MEADVVRIVFTSSFILISQLGLDALYHVCNQHFDSINVQHRSKLILNELSQGFAKFFNDVRREAFKLLADHDQVYSLLACNLVNIEASEPLMILLDEITSKLDVISVVTIRLPKGLDMNISGDAFHGLLKYYLVLDGDPEARLTTSSNSYVLSSKSSFILDASLQMRVQNTSDHDLIVLCLEISKPFSGYDEMINVIAMQCIASHEEIQEKCLQNSLNSLK